MTDHSHGAVSQAWANAQRDLPHGWRIDDLREGAARFHPSSVVAQAQARQVEQSRVENLGDPWKASAVGPNDLRVEVRGHDAIDALDRLVHKVRRSAGR